MSTQLHNELKKEFQLERMVLFSDAVFAIAITLLVIEIKVPELHEATDRLLGIELLHMIPKFIGFFVSFFVIGIYWVAHHRIFGYLNTYSTRLIWMNLFFLLSIVLMPFTTAFYSEYSAPWFTLPFGIYIANICFTGYMNYRLWMHITDVKNGLTEVAITPLQRNYGKWRTLTVPAVFLVGLVLAFIAPFFSRFTPMLIPVFMALLSRRFAKLGLSKEHRKL